MKLVVQFSSGKYINIEADHIERDEGIVYGYHNNGLVAVIDLGTIDYLYLSEVKG